MVHRGPQERTKDSPQEAAAAIFVLCFPLLIMDAVRRAHPMASSRFHMVAADCASLAPGLIEDDPRTVVSSAWIDLSEGPIAVRLPHTRGRHFSFTVMDTTGEPFVSLGTRTSEDTGLDLILAGPNWHGEVRRGFKAKRSPSDACWAISRIHAHSMLDRAETAAIAKRQGLVAMDQGGERRWTNDVVLDPLPASYLWQVMEIPPELFFHRLDAILERAPTSFQRANRERLTALRAFLGGPPPSSAWSAKLRDELARGMDDGLAAIRGAGDRLLVNQGVGWRRLIAPHDHPESALETAARAYLDLGAPPCEDLLTLICDLDEAGKALWGPNAYRLAFPADALPPVQGFWRLYARPAASASRRGVSSRNDLLLNPDGSLDLMIQQAPPDASDAANWLPAPGAELSLVMRLYSPQPAALSGAWRMPPVRRVEPGADDKRRGDTTAPLRATPSGGLQSTPPVWRYWA